VIDKLELRLPSGVYFRPQVRSAIREVDFATNRTRVKPSQHYAGVLDLRSLGTDGLLHYRRKRDGASGNHKLELLDSGKRSYSELVFQIENVVDANIDPLEIMRIDLCVDIRDVPVQWFYARLRFAHKRLSREIGTLKHQSIGKSGLETISAGQRPNMFRVYDKVEECKMQLRKMQRRASKDADSLTLTSEFGIGESDIITRIERQHGGGRIPPSFARFGDLHHLPEYNPFQPLRIVTRDRFRQPSIAERGIDEWLKGTRLNELSHEMGMPKFMGWLGKHSGGNSARMMRKYKDYFETGSARVTVGSIFETYRNSVIKQLAA
jgi:hypothetical protein